MRQHSRPRPRPRPVPVPREPRPVCLDDVLAVQVTAAPATGLDIGWASHPESICLRAAMDRDALLDDEPGSPRRVALKDRGAPDELRALAELGRSRR